MSPCPLSSVCTTLDGDDLRKLPRYRCARTNLARLLRSRSEGIFIAPFETGEIGPDLFRHACKFGLEGWSRSVVTVPIAAGCWIKVKNRQHPAFSRVQDQFG